MSTIYSKDLLSPFPSQYYSYIDNLLTKEFEESPFKILVLDDDPTGVQTVYNVNVYTNWQVNTLKQAFKSDNKLFFVLTNSRALTEEQTIALHTQLVENALSAATACNCQFIIVSRGDSTLRGHYPLETTVIANTLKQCNNTQIDGVILCPYFAEGGRFTVNNTHYVKNGDVLTPSGETEFAKDKTFGYTQSDLRLYIKEKTNGAVEPKDVICIALTDLRNMDFDKITSQLLNATNSQSIVVNATDDYDVKVFCIALYRAMAKGKRFLLRTAAAMTKAIGNIPSRPLLTRSEMVSSHTENGGIVVVGSHTQKTTSQLNCLLRLKNVVAVELNSDLVLNDDNSLENEALRVTKLCDDYIKNGVTPVVFTKRALLNVENDTKEAALLRSVRISQAVQSVVGNLQATPAFVVAKGGITSSDIGTKALNVACAKVLGQIKAGIPVWQTGAESKFPATPYIIFPGNVGEETTLRDAVNTLLTK